MKLLTILFMIFVYEVTSQTTSCDDNESKLAAITKLICKTNTTTTGPKGF